jgi:hypothetical protein
VAQLTIPPHLARDIAASGSEEREASLADLQRTITALSDRWSLMVGEPYLPGGWCARVAPARAEPEDNPPGRVGSDGSAPVGDPGPRAHEPTDSPRSSPNGAGDPDPDPDPEVHRPNHSLRSSADGASYPHHLAAGVSL